MPETPYQVLEDARGSAILCATVSGLTAQLRSTLWDQPRPILLTSSTLAVGSDFRALVLFTS